MTLAFRNINRPFNVYCCSSCRMLARRGWYSSPLFLSSSSSALHYVRQLLRLLSFFQRLHWLSPGLCRLLPIHTFLFHLPRFHHQWRPFPAPPLHRRPLLGFLTMVAAEPRGEDEWDRLLHLQHGRHGSDQSWEQGQGKGWQIKAKGFPHHHCHKGSTFVTVCWESDRRSFYVHT